MGFPSAWRASATSPPLSQRGGARGGVSLSQAVHPQPSFALIGAKVPLRGTCCLACCDQAACIFDALAWSFEQNRVFDPLCIFDAQLHTRNRKSVILNEGGRLPSPFPKGRGRGWGFTLPGMHPQPPLPFPKGEGPGVGFPSARRASSTSPPLSQRGGAGGGVCNKQVLTHFYYHSCLQTPPLPPPL